jgi:hypothetical protein
MKRTSAARVEHGPEPIEIHPGLRVQVVEVTPSIATHWLKHNHADNRTLGERTVEGMANDMRSGAWKLTHQAIAFNGDGDLIDGQHRLSAVVMANVPVQMFVVWNDTSDLKDPIDRIRPRSLGFITGHRTNVIAALGVLRSLESGYDVQSALTVADIEELTNKHGDTIKFCLENIQSSHRTVGGLLAALAWAKPIAADAVIDFGHKVMTGEMLAGDSPAYAYRNWKERNKGMSPWLVCMASLNCIRYHVQDLPLVGVYTTDSGYRATVSQRRLLKISNTPDTSLVESMSWAPKSGASSR